MKRLFLSLLFFVTSPALANEMALIDVTDEVPLDEVSVDDTDTEGAGEAAVEEPLSADAAAATALADLRTKLEAKKAQYVMPTDEAFVTACRKTADDYQSGMAMRAPLDRVLKHLVSDSLSAEEVSETRQTPQEMRKKAQDKIDTAKAEAKQAGEKIPQTEKAIATMQAKIAKIDAEIAAIDLLQHGPVKASRIKKPKLAKKWNPFPKKVAPVVLPTYPTEFAGCLVAKAIEGQLPTTTTTTTTTSKTK